MKQSNITLEDISTWPTQIKDLCEENKILFVNYLNESKSIEQLGYTDILLRNNPPTNKYQSEYLNAERVLNDLLSQNSYTGYHCSRLTNNEIQTILNKGLTKLSKNFIV